MLYFNHFFSKFDRVKNYFKYLFSFVIGIYLINNIGLPVYYHYCCGELESINPLFKTQNCCGENEDEDSGCCNNETKIISQKSECSINNFHLKMVPQTLALHYFSVISSFNSKFNLSEGFINNIILPPPKSGRFILNNLSILII